MQMTQRLINEQGIYPLYLLKAKQEQKHKNNDNSKISKLKKRTDQSPLKQPKQLWNKPT